MKSADIRRKFLEFFKARGHQEVPSSPLVPADDPTLLFTNAGMVQFKRVFQGLEQRDYSRATTCQKCVRAGGKHNDLEQVGHTARHHTFFEIFVDLRGHRKGELSAGQFEALQDAGHVTEIWNLVFMQYDLQKDGSRVPLPKPSVDTGAGLERISAVLQDVPSNFDTDLFAPLIERAVEVVGRPYDR